MGWEGSQVVAQPVMVSGTAEAGQGGGGRCRVSVIIPAFNESRWIDATLAALLAQEARELDVDICVIDTGSTDATCERVQAHPVSLLRVEERSSYVARNAGLQASTAELFAFLDADCIPQPGWLQALVDCARHSGSDYVAGRIENEIVVDNLGNQLLAYRTSADVRRQSVAAGNVAAGNMLVHRRVFDRLGPFEPLRSGADILHSQRAIAAGFWIDYAANAVVRHQCDLSNLDYLRRRFRIRRGQMLSRGGSNPAMTALRAFPWRPGIRESARVAAFTGRPKLGVLAFLWLERWAEFCGTLVGMRDRARLSRQRTNIQGVVGT